MDNKEITMTTRQYLDKVEQEEIDKIFDDAIREAREKELSRQAKLEQEEKFKKLMSILATREAELQILEDMYKEMYESKQYQQYEIDEIKTKIKTQTMLYTKVKNEVNRFISMEKHMKT